MVKDKFYVTTPIYYTNASPHLGGAYTTIAADILARWNKLLGKDVFFLTGTDEHGQKIQETAEKVGKTPKEFVDEIANEFKEAFKLLNISNNNFIRTTDTYHEKEVKEIFQKLYDKKFIYKGFYEALYCIGCEQYKTENDLVDGKCPLHNREPELRKEEAYLFKLSAFQDKLLKAIKKEELNILPIERRREIITFIEEGLRDISISRLKSKIYWGIELPFDKKHTAFVWVDAFWNYISGLKTETNKKKFWPADVQLMAKDIIRVHATIWAAILLALDYKLPKKMFVHGYFTVNGQKMSKSLGNVISPINLTKKYGADSVRYYLMRNIAFGQDGDVSEKSLIERHNTELANKLGNLVARVSTLAEKYGLEKSKPLNSSNLTKKVEQHLENLEFDKALNEIFQFIDLCNVYIQNKKPWETQDKEVLYQLSDAIKDIAILLFPFMPETSEKIAKTFSFEISLASLDKPLKISPIKKSDILFKKIDVDVNMGNKVPNNNLSNNPHKPINNKQINNNINKPINKINRSNKYNNQQTSDNNKPINKPLGDNDNNLNTKKDIPGIIKMDQIKFDDFAKVDLRVGTIKKIEDIEGADKLYKLEVQIGKDSRTICAGIKQHYKKDELKDKQIIVITNLEPRKMKGIESQGMLLAAVSEDHSKVVLISPEKKVDSGLKVS